MKQSICILFMSLLLAVVTFYFIASLPFINIIYQKSYDVLFKIEYKLRPPPLAINDILLVTIDNDTLKNMPQAWPYPRSDFAKVIENLKKAGAKVIGIDFVFLGKSTIQDDELLRTALGDDNKVILASAIDESGALNLDSLSGISSEIPRAIITKLQDSDGIIRKNLIYLVSKKEPHKGFLSWEMQILKSAKSIDLSSLISSGSYVSFKNNAGEKWTIPVDPKTRSFLIHFCAHTIDFKRLSFYQVLKGNFDPTLVKDKIVLVGFLSSLLGDLHNTPLGFLPGITLNANAFLTLYTHDFIKNVPKFIELFILIIGVILSTIFTLSLSTKKALLLIMGEIFFFLVISYVLFTQSYIWNYSLFPFTVVVCPFLNKKLYSLFVPRRRQ